MEGYWELACRFCFPWPSAGEIEWLSTKCGSKAVEIWIGRNTPKWIKAGLYHGCTARNE